MEPVTVHLSLFGFYNTHNHIDISKPFSECPLFDFVIKLSNKKFCSTQIMKIGMILGCPNKKVFCQINVLEISCHQNFTWKQLYWNMRSIKVLRWFPQCCEVGFRKLISRKNWMVENLLIFLKLPFHSVEIAEIPNHTFLANISWKQWFC